MRSVAIRLYFLRTGRMYCSCRSQRPGGIARAAGSPLAGCGRPRNSGALSGPAEAACRRMRGVLHDRHFSAAMPEWLSLKRTGMQSAASPPILNVFAGGRTALDQPHLRRPSMDSSDRLSTVAPVSSRTAIPNEISTSLTLHGTTCPRRRPNVSISAGLSGLRAKTTSVGSIWGRLHTAASANF
jgi:hypothetical protein